MDFRPAVNEVIEIGEPFVFNPHPVVAGIAYGQTGRRGTVYQIRNSQNHLFHALKVFSEYFQDPRTAVAGTQLRAFGQMPGLQVCHRNVITARRYPALVSRYPQLEYGVLMPWVEGDTWFDLMYARAAVSVRQSLRLTGNFVACLARLEYNGIAHCDLSSGNVLIMPGSRAVNLVDVDEMYAPGLKPPDARKLPAGTPGYGHKTAVKGIWRADADRFAGAVLIAEFLGWVDGEVRESASGTQYFEEDEVQKDSERYDILVKALRSHWGEDIAGAFARAWRSEQISDCISFGEWQQLLNDRVRAHPLPGSPLVEPVSEEPAQSYKEYALFYQHEEEREFSLFSPVVNETLEHRANQFVRRQFGVSRLTTVMRRWLFVGVIGLILALAGAASGYLWAYPVGQGSLSGRILDDKSRPVAAEVTLSGLGLPRTVTADGDGKYAFSNLPSGPGILEVVADQYGATSKKVEISSGLQEENMTLAVAAQYVGTVTDGKNGPGLDQVTVTISGINTVTRGVERIVGSSDATGKYELFVNVGIEEAKMSFSKDGYSAGKDILLGTIVPGMAGKQLDYVLTKN